MTKREFVLISDSCCDLSAQMVQDCGLVILPLYLEMGGATYRNFPDGREISFEDFYSRIRAGELATTAAVNAGDFEAAMREQLSQGRDVLCICFSSALSATYQSACIAAEEVRGEFPGQTVEVVDSLCASMGQGLLLYLCAQEQKAGRSLAEVRDFAMQKRDYIRHWFTVDDLNHLKRGGRISATTAFFGTMLAIKPVLQVDAEGRLIPVSKCRGRKAALSALVEHYAEEASDPASEPVFLSHSDCLDDAQWVADEITRRFGNRNIAIHYIGPVIGNHTGTGTVALFYPGSKR